MERLGYWRVGGGHRLEADRNRCGQTLRVGLLLATTVVLLPWQETPLLAWETRDTSWKYNATPPHAMAPYS